MKKSLAIVFSLTLAVLVLTTSCRKKKEEEEKPSDGATTESNEAQSQWDDVLRISEDAIENKGQTSRIEAEACASITIDTTPDGIFAGTITVNFGSTPTLCYGKTRKGKIIIKYTGKYRTTGTVIQTTTEDYYVNDKQIIGKRTVTNNGSNNYTVVDSDEAGTGYAQVKYSDGKITTWKSTRTRAWTSGSSTYANFLDDVYTINGDGSGTTRDGYNYKVSIVNLVVKLECYFTAYTFMPSSGKINVTNSSGGELRSIDYGNGSCDRNIIYTHTNGKTYELSL